VNTCDHGWGVAPCVPCLQAALTAERERADIAEAERDVLRSNQLGPVPEGPLKALGAWVADHTDEDEWAAAERYLNAALAELTAERERAERCRNSVVEACVEYPNVGEYIAQVEAERDALRELVARTECTCGAAKMPFWRCCKTLEPVAKVHIKRTGGNVGIAWHAIGIDGSLPALADGEVLYVLRTALEGK